MTDKTNDDEEKEKPKLKSLEDFVHPDEEPKTLDFNKAKEEKELKSEKPKLESKFDFMDGQNFIVFKSESHHGQLQVHCHAIFNMTEFIPEGMGYYGPEWVENCLGFKVVELRWWDKFFGVKTIEQKFEKIATLFSDEMKSKLKKEDEHSDMMKKFSR